MLVHRKPFIATVAVAAGLMLAVAAHAQTTSQAPPPAAGLNLTDAQRDQVRAMRETQRKEAQALHEKLRAARQQLREAQRADVPDEAAVRAAATALGALQADQAALQARSRAQFMALLTPEQQAQVKQARTRAAQRAMRANRQSRMHRQQIMRLERQLQRQYYRLWRDRI